MKTIIIYNDLEEELRFSIVDGDFSRFNGISFSGSVESDLEIECNNWLWTEKGEFKIELLNDVSLLEDKNWDKVAVITFTP